MEETSSLYYQNEGFSLFRTKDCYFFRHKNGAQIQTDKLLASLWQKAHEKNFSQLYREVNKETGVSCYLLQKTLDLLTTADLLRIKEQQRDQGPVSSSSFPLRSPFPLVTVIILNYNGKEHLETLLPSVINQSYQNFEVIVVDNNSSDGSGEFVRKNFPEIKILELKRNYGFSGGNNKGIKEAKGDFIFLLNSDTKLGGNCLEELVKFAQDKPDLAVVAPKIRFFSLPQFINAIGNSVPPQGWGSDNFIGHLDLGQFDGISHIFSACFGAAFLSRKALEEVGLLDSGYDFYYEDSDWCYRAWLRGFKTYFAPEALVYHKFSATMNTLSAEYKLGLVITSRLRFASKNLNSRLAFNFLRNYLKEDLRHFLGCVRRLNYKRALIYLKAWFRFFLSLPGILRLRWQIQKKRRPEVDEGYLLSLQPKLPPLVNSQNWPLLDTRTIRRIYMHLDS